MEQLSLFSDRGQNTVVDVVPQYSLAPSEIGDQEPGTALEPISYDRIKFIAPSGWLQTSEGRSAWWLKGQMEVVR